MDALRLYNTLSRRIEPFVPLVDHTVGMYSCGLTVYNFAHIGNLRTYLFEDVLRRVLEYNGYTVTHAMNVTDVGHLVSDADEGEDKMEVGARREGKDPLAIAREYEQAFFEDLRKLNVELPTKVARATETIAAQIALIQELEKKGFTYRDEAAIYFDTSKLTDYGKLTGQTLADKKTGAREDVVVDQKKKHPADFVLWFFLSGRYANHILHWPSPWGEGFPGWHIECSAISRSLLGQPFDIHTGGVDHIGTHHTNEIAQSEAAFGVPLARFWLHGEFLRLNNEKMAKSAGETLLLSTLMERGFSPLAYRYFTLTTHYRKPLSFNWDGLQAAQNALDALVGKVRMWPEPTEILSDYSGRFLEAVNDDLNVPKALGVVWEMMKSDTPNAEKHATLNRFDDVLGLGLKNVAPRTIPDEIRALADKREAARRSKDFGTADALRTEILEAGYLVDDTEAGFVLKLK